MNCRGKLLDLTTPVVMGILNLTPDSFYDGGTLKSESAILLKVEQMLKEGAVILDVGGMSSRPGAEIISEEDELNRVIGPIESVSRAFPEAIISVDTIRSTVAQKALDAGAHIINDISGGEFDDRIYKVAGDNFAPYVLMHMQGTPENMQPDPVYNNVVLDVTDYFSKKVESIKACGVKDIILDPGFGFGKSLEHNYTLMAQLDYFKIFGLPVLAGVSRKSMINKVIKTKPDGALNGTTVLNTIALQNGANILRVHDVKEAVEAIELVDYYSKNKLKQ